MQSPSLWRRHSWLPPRRACATPPCPVYTYEVVHTYPHDTAGVHRGLFYHEGFLYESTGLNGRSSIRKVRLETGEVLQKSPSRRSTSAKASSAGRGG